MTDDSCRAEVYRFAMAEQAKMATYTYYAYNVPAGMTRSDFATMIGRETDCTSRVTNVSILQDSEAVLTFEKPGYCAA